jgi:hypothetical protein
MLQLQCVTCAARDTRIRCVHLFSLLNLRSYQIIEVRWTDHITYIRQKSNSYKILAGKIERRRPLRRPGRRWENSIKPDHKQDVTVLTRLKCLRIATRGSLFFATHLSSGFHEMQEVCLLLEEQLISQVRRYDMRLSSNNPRTACTPLLFVCESSD